MELNQESEEQKIDKESSNQEKIKEWLADNMRIIISILIVVLIAGGIYSYSKRTETPVVDEEIAITDEESTDEENNEKTESTEEKIATQSETVQKNEESKTSSISISQETENSFIETAVRGDSRTKLARKALANFLEKNPDSGLTAEHKIYIEDYLRKKVQHSGGISVGTSMEFSKDLIKEAISKSKNLNENQLNNLHKYAVQVPSLS